MTVKGKITKADYDALSSELKGIYKQVGDDYVLDYEDKAFDTLKSENATLKAEKEKHEAELAEKVRKAEEAAAAREAAKYKEAMEKNDAQAVAKSWSEKYEKLEGDLKSEKERYNNYVRKSLVDAAVSEMAERISTSPALIRPHIASRLDVDLSGAEPVLFVKDEKGMRSALTIQELEKSFIDNKDYSAIIKHNSTNGGASGQNQTQPQGGAYSGVNQQSGGEHKNLLDMSFDEAVKSGR